MSKKTKKPSGLSISRDKSKFTFSWKIAAKNHNDGQKLRWVMTRGYQFKSVNDRIDPFFNDRIEIDDSIGKKKTSESISIDLDSFYPKKNIVLKNVEFYIKGKRDGSSWSEESGKSFAINPPAKPKVSVSLGSTSTQAFFSWTVKTSDNDHAPAVDTEWETIIVKNCMLSASKGSSLDWSKPAAHGTDAGVSGSKSFTHDASLFKGNYCFSRWIRVRSRGPGGPSNWTYSRLIFAVPNTPTNVTVTGTKLSSGDIRCTTSWAIDVTNRPISYAKVEYAIASPVVTVQRIQNKMVSKVGAPNEPGWKDAPGGDAISETSKKDGWVFDVDDPVTMNTCLWVRVGSVYSVNPNVVHSAAVRAKGLGILSKPIFSAGVDYQPGSGATAVVNISATSEASTQIPNSFIAIYYRLSSDPSKSTCIGIIPPGSDSITFLAPKITAPDNIEFGLQSYVASYSPAEPSSTAVTKYAITDVIMKSGISWEDGSIPKPPTNVSLTPVSSEVIQVNWDWTWDSADSAELSWSTHDDAWESTDPPQTFVVSNLYANSGNKSTQWRIAGLSPGKWYVRVRLMKSSGEAVTYGTYSEIEEINLASAPAIPTLMVRPEVISEEESVTCTWAYVSTDGTAQSQADICVATVDPETGDISYSDPLEDSASGNVQSITLQASKYGWQEGDTVNLCVRVRSISGEVSEGWSAPASFQVAKKPTISIDDQNTSITTIDVVDPDDPSEVREGVSSITDLPIHVAYTGSGENDDVVVSIIRHQEDSMHEDCPDEDTLVGFAGESIVYGVSGKVSDGYVDINKEHVVGFLNDGGKFVLRVEVIDAYGQTNSDTREFEVHWAHQAVYPTAQIYINTDDYISLIHPLIPDANEFADGDAFNEEDYCEIYRLSVDKPQLIVPHAEFGKAYVDQYPTLGRYGGYRIVYKTKNGDYTTYDNHYAWTNYGLEENATLDLFATIIDFDGDRVILPYDLSISSKWSKDFKKTKYLGGSIQGDWNKGVDLSTTVNTRVISLEDPDVVESVRRLADYAGACNIRTPDGANFHANIDVQKDDEEKWINRLTRVTLSISRVDAPTDDGILLENWMPDEEIGE